jgi:hypothetical protein
MKKEIEFVTDTETVPTEMLVRSKSRSSPPYEDFLLAPEFQPHKFIFPRGKTCIRLLPRMKGSPSWMQIVKVLNHQNGRHVHPKSLDNAAQSVFDVAYRWFKSNEPNLLFSKSNRDGFRLLSSPLAICWFLVDDGGETKAKLFVGSPYDGSRGGSPGLAHQLNKLAREITEPGGQDATHSEHGVQITVEKSIPLGEKYPTYQMTRHHVAVPIQRYIDRMSESEVNAICPLNDVIRKVGEQEEWDLLAKVIGKELRDKIRETTQNNHPLSIESDDLSHQSFT